eukprot:6093230-Amphidinium_carterae.1
MNLLDDNIVLERALTINAGIQRLLKFMFPFSAESASSVSNTSRGLYTPEKTETHPRQEGTTYTCRIRTYKVSLEGRSLSTTSH